MVVSSHPSWRVCSRTSVCPMLSWMSSRAIAPHYLCVLLWNVFYSNFHISTLLQIFCKQTKSDTEVHVLCKPSWACCCSTRVMYCVYICVCRVKYMVLISHCAYSQRVSGPPLLLQSSVTYHARPSSLSVSFKGESLWQYLTKHGSKCLALEKLTFAKRTR